ncbi:PAS domain-containing sensor histidine kinase [Pseudodesulfovibrio pelocollis]|uniref:PAS domain-containing sensor histidine kinase n=1 Tax=Pseudodesulfovibrio pelocollis TaxID=3051432 RepID=UPI00255A9009|nr:PAS domain-containing sensor histidine kinase [Pseudodesulfovibrio sp. SB368]
MKRRADRPAPDPGGEREKLIGLGRRSISKSYYPELRNRLGELERFRSLLDRVSDAIFVVDCATGLVADVSGATPAMLGCGRDAVVGRPFRDLLPEHIARYADNLFNLSTETMSLETEFRHPATPDRPPVPVEMSLRIVEHGEARQAVIVARDISERKRGEEALRRSHDELEIRVRERTRELARANKAKTEFLSIVSHELRTPLTSIIGFAKIIRKKLGERVFPAVDQGLDPRLGREMDRIARNIDIIEAEGERLTALINDVLDLAKLEANRVEYRMESLDPADFLRPAMDSSSALFEGSDVLFLDEVEKDLPRIRGDRHRLIQVMVNLFSNAAKFTGQGSVSCRASRVGDHLRFSVADTGAGIAPAQRAVIFDKFTQGQESLADRPRGTGLGLPICKQIVEDHRGHIWVESEPGRGSEFIFTLPVDGA